MDSNFVENISIVVAAKNEESNIPLLIKALNEQNYPDDKFEIIIVNDNSTDNTYQVLTSFSKKISNLKVFIVENKNITGKKGALTEGISKSKYNIIAITDADCIPEKDWLKNISFNINKGYDFIFGAAPFIRRKNIINQITCFENFRSTLLSFSFANIGIPYTASARNMAFNKKAFEKIEGYKNTSETLSGDDDLLLREAVKNNLKVGTFFNKNSFVLSETKTNFKDYLTQKSRHTKTSFHYLFSRQLALGLWHILNLFFLISPLLMFINSIFISLFIVKIIVDLIIVFPKQKKLNYNFSLLQIFYLQIFYEIFLIINFVNALFRKDKWK